MQEVSNAGPVSRVLLCRDPQQEADQLVEVHDLHVGLLFVVLERKKRSYCMFGIRTGTEPVTMNGRESLFILSLSTDLVNTWLV